MAAIRTIPPDKRLLQILVSIDAWRRIKVEAANFGKTPGDVVTRLAEQYLPAPPPTEDPNRG